MAVFNGTKKRKKGIERCITALTSPRVEKIQQAMVGVSLEELTISESSPEASTAPTTLTSHSSSNLSHDFLPRFPNPAPRERSRKERSSSSLTETLTKDLSLLLRSNSRLKCDKHTGSQTVLHPLPEEYKDNSDYAHNLSRNSSNLSKLDLESRMLRQRDTDKVKRSENKFYGFLRRGRLASRSAPEKRRSRSADEIVQMDQALQSSLSLANGSHSIPNHASRFGLPHIKHRPISPSSRPPSVAAVTFNKQLPQPPSDITTSTPRPAMNPTHVTTEPEHAKPRKKTFFGMITLPGSRRSSISKSHPTTPHSSTPDNSLNARHQRKPDLPSLPNHRDFASIPLNDTTNYRWNGDVAGQRSQPSFEISEPDSGLGIETIVAKTKLVTILSPRPHLNSVPDVPVRASSTPPRIGNEAHRLRRESVDESDRLRLPDPRPPGRISPLPFMPLVSSRKKGKEREICGGRANDLRKTTPVPTSGNEKGRESQNSKPNATNISGPMNIKITGRVKHGSFDFERPLSTSVGYPVRTARWSSSGSYPAPSESERNVNSRGNGLWNGLNPSTYPIQEERPTPTRSQSVRESDRERSQPKIRFTDETKDKQTRSRNPHDTRSRTQPQPQHSSLPSKSAGRETGPPKNGIPVSTHMKLPYRPEGGSLGRRTHQRLGLGVAGHTDGLPLSGMPAASLHPNGNVTGSFSRSNSPQAVTLPMDRHAMKWHTGKGRSLDLGLGLNWAPTRVREEAVMDFRQMGVRSKWREEAETKELSRTKVLESFEEVLGDSDYAKFKEYVQRFDSRLIPLDGSSGLTHKVRRLLDTSAKGLDLERKNELLEILDLLVHHPR